MAVKALVFISIFLFISHFLAAEEPPDEAADERLSREFLNLTLADTSVSLRMYGRWKGTLNASLGLASTPYGTEAITGDTPFFMQEGDITLSLWIRDRWFVEAGFMDDSNLNTYRAGYQGLDGEAVRYLGVGNTGLDFPSFPYMDLGGDSPSSFGLYGHFGAGKLSIHTLVRYDAAAREERIFVGSRERSFSFMNLSRPQRGVSFVLPDDNLDSRPEVYIQDNKGDLRGSDGRRWRLAEPSEYGASAQYGLIELTLGAYTAGSGEPEGMIAVSYTKGGNNAPWTLSLSAGYGASGSPAPGFLGDIQEWFDRSGRNWNIASLPQCGGGNPNLEISGIPVLVIYEPGAFSPFEKQNRYIAPYSTSYSAELVKLSNGEFFPGYEVIPLNENAVDGLVLNPEINPVRRSVYEIIPGGPRKRQSPDERWPLGNMYPELYLPGRTVFTEDLGIRFTNYSASDSYNIGTDVVPGSVQVYRNGIIDPNISFSPYSGTVSLANPAGFSEVIRITYLKQSTETRLGSLAAGLGAVWNPDGPFSGKLGLGLRWNVTSNSYSESGATSPGTVGLGAEAKWDYTHLKAGITLGLGFEQPDTTGLYRVSGMEESEWILPLPPESSFLSEEPALPVIPGSLKQETRSSLVYRNYRDNSVLTGTTLSDIGGSGSVVSGRQGPYPAMDGELASQVLAAEFDFSSGEKWTGFQTPLGFNGEFLERAEKIEIPYRFSNFSRTPDPDELSVYIQFGSLSDKDTGNMENQNLIMAKKLFTADPDVSEITASSSFHAARIAQIYLTDDDRSKLQAAKYLRLLIVWNEGSSENLSGRVILAPPIVRGAAWRPVTVRNDVVSPARNLPASGSDVSAREEMDNKSNIRLAEKYSAIINRLHSESSRQRVLEISWKSASGIFSGGDTGPGADGRLAAIPLSNYRSLSFFVRRPKAASYSAADDEDDPSTGQYKLDRGTLRFIIGSGPSSARPSEETALDVFIPLEAFKSAAPGEWARVDIQYRSNSRVLVDGNPAGGAQVKYNSAAASRISGGNAGGGSGSMGDLNAAYAAFLLIPAMGGDFPDGDMAVDEIFMEDSVSSYRLNNGVLVEWSRPGAILKIRETAVLSDFAIHAAIETGAQGNPFEETNDGAFGMNGRSRAEISLLGVRLTGNYAYSFSSSQSSNDYSWSAGHSLSRAFGPFSVRESFENSPGDNTMNHRLSLALDTRVRASISAEVVYENERLRRRWQAGTGGKPSEKAPFSFSLEAAAGITENPGGLALSNYAAAWIYSFADMLPDSGSGAERRELQGNFRIGLETAPLGSELNFRMNSLSSAQDQINQAGSLLRLDFPISPNPARPDLRMLFRIEREYRRNIFTVSSNFNDDSRNWGQSFSDAVPLMFSIPFYSLFDSAMEGRMDEFVSLDGANLSQFADAYEFSFQKGQSYGLSSFIVPRRFSFRLGRMLERRLETPRDTINIGAGLNFSSINMFGAMGYRPLFSFYRNDEFTNSLQTQISIPKNEAVSWNVRADQAMRFHAVSGAEMIVNNTFVINSSSRTGEGSRWTDSLSVSWMVPMESTLLGMFYAYLMRLAGRQGSWLTLANLANLKYELLRNETLEFVIERIPNVTDGDYFRFSIVAGHESIVRIFGKLNLSAFAKIRISQNFNTDVLSFLGTIGASLHLMF